MIKSWPAKAETSIIKVDLGKWKLVIKQSIALNSYPGYIKIEVASLVATNLPYFCMQDSKVLVEVVPIEIILLPSFFAFFYISADSWDIS